MRERGGRKDDDDCTRDASATEVRGTLRAWAIGARSVWSSEGRTHIDFDFRSARMSLRVQLCPFIRMGHWSLVSSIHSIVPHSTSTFSFPSSFLFINRFFFDRLTNIYCALNLCQINLLFPFLIHTDSNHSFDTSVNFIEKNIKKIKT